MRSDQITAIILAAGESTRMGISKALLPLRGVSFLERIVGLYKTAGTEIVVVLGKNQEEIESKTNLIGTIVLNNPRPEQGPLSSLHIALKQVRDSSALLIHPVDHPLVQAATVSAILKTHRRVPACVVIPEYQGKKGHPVLFPFRFYPDLLTAPVDKGARWVVRQNPAIVLRVAVDDSGITKNLNTLEEYLEATAFPNLDHQSGHEMRAGDPEIQ